MACDIIAARSPFQSFPQNFTLFKINNPAAIRLEKLFFEPDVMPSYLL